jgi:predicted transcriptional regulator
MALSDKFLAEVKEKILYLLASEPLTTRELEARSGYSYSTIRRCLNELLDDKKITSVCVTLVTLSQ